MITTARRVGSLAEVTEPGDYFGPADGWTGDRPAVFFLLPTAEGPNPLWRADPKYPANGLYHVCSPPHVFRECDDGSLEIRESIGAYGTGPIVQGAYVWHGYLDEGHSWRQV